MSIAWKTMESAPTTGEELLLLFLHPITGKPQVGTGKWVDRQVVQRGITTDHSHWFSLHPTASEHRPPLFWARIPELPDVVSIITVSEMRNAVNSVAAAMVKEAERV